MNSNTFTQLLKESFKSNDTEEWLDVHFTRPIGLVFALMWNRLGIHPNVITVISIFLGAAAGWFFHYTDLSHNLLAVGLLMLANFCDSTDGQMARLTLMKTALGRVLDGTSSTLWYIAMYIAVCCRVQNDPIPFFPGHTWGWIIWAVAIVCGLLGHAQQCTMADRYRNIHLFFLKNKHGDELHRSKDINRQRLSELRR